MVAIALKGLEKGDLADKAGCTRQSMHNWLAGRTSPNLAAIEAMAKVLKMKVSELIALGEE